MGESQPCLRLGLRPLSDDSRDPASGTKQAFFGQEFEVPWLNGEAKASHHQATLISPEGIGLIFWDPADRQHLPTYNLLAQTLGVSPEQISPGLSKHEANRRLTLLRMKSAIYCYNHSGFRFYQWQALRCVQLGEPGDDLVVEVSCFDSTGKELNFHFSANGAKLTQLQINRVVQTVHPSVTASSGVAEPANGNKN